MIVWIETGKPVSLILFLTCDMLDGSITLSSSQAYLKAIIILLTLLYDQIRYFYKILTTTIGVEDIKVELL